jgi:hypothetical protein
MLARGQPLEGALKVLTLAVRIAIAWTLLSLLLTAFWVLLLEVGRRFGSRPASKPPAREERRLSAEVRAIYADFGDDDRTCGEALVPCEPDETAGSDAVVLLAGTASARKR